MPDSTFGKHIRDYFRERIGIVFVERDYGFVGYKIIGTDLYIEEWYTEPEHPLIDTLSMIREAIAIGKSYGCTRMLGANETTLPSTKDINTFHRWFRMRLVGIDGSREWWGKDI